MKIKCYIKIGLCVADVEAILCSVFDSIGMVACYHPFTGILFVKLEINLEDDFKCSCYQVMTSNALLCLLFTLERVENSQLVMFLFLHCIALCVHATLLIIAVVLVLQLIRCILQI